MFDLKMLKLIKMYMWCISDSGFPDNWVQNLQKLHSQGLAIRSLAGNVWEDWAEPGLQGWTCSIL